MVWSIRSSLRDLQSDLVKLLLEAPRGLAQLPSIFCVPVNRFQDLALRESRDCYYSLFSQCIDGHCTSGTVRLN